MFAYLFIGALLLFGQFIVLQAIWRTVSVLVWFGMVIVRSCIVCVLEVPFCLFSLVKIVIFALFEDRWDDVSVGFFFLEGGNEVVFVLVEAVFVDIFLECTDMTVSKAGYFSQVEYSCCVGG